MTDHERFWSKVDKNGPTQAHMSTPCWVWTGATTMCTSRPSVTHRYGSFRFKGSSRRANRVAWTLTYGDPGAAVVRHDCDNSLCVNPSHLRLGTQADNANDTAMRGRARNGRQDGEHNGCAKLTSAQVVDARAACANGETKAAVARRLGVSRSTISALVLGKRWRAS